MGIAGLYDFRPFGAVPPDRFTPRGRSTGLIVLVHGFVATPATMRHVEAALAESRPDDDVLAPGYDGRSGSFADPEAVARDLAARIEDCCARRPYGEIRLIGHSCGALLLRRGFLLARERSRGVAPDAPAAWPNRVARIVLLAGTNRGWSISEHQHRRLAVLARVTSAVGAAVVTLTGRTPLAFAMRRGAPFVVDLRLAWLQAAADGGAALPPTVQLLGTVDDMVSPHDNVDLHTDHGFVYRTIPRSGHADVILMGTDPGELPAPDDLAARRARAAALREAVSAPLDALREDSVFREADPALRELDRAVTDVVFVVHGIRDLGFWTEKIALEIERAARRAGTPPRRVERETASYGYFTMAPFLRPAERRAKVEWLMDRYAERRARHPRARFHFVGHSNGTYLLASAMERYPACSFESVVFAGSVVRSAFPWRDYLGARVKRVLNYVATADWVVAGFPNGLEQLGLQDLGGAGHRGFSHPGKIAIGPAAGAGPVPDGTVVEARLVRGAHGAALDEDHWPCIAGFVAQGEIGALPAQRYATDQAAWTRRLGEHAYAVWLIAAMLAAAILAWLVWTVASYGLAPYAPLLVAAVIWYVVLKA